MPKYTPLRIKASIFLLLVAISPIWTFAQVNMNYVIKNTLQDKTVDENAIDGLTKKQMIQNIIYFDDLGRPLQEVSTQASPLGRDLVLHHEYDEMGRERKQYLPYASTETTGNFKADAVGKIQSFYNGQPGKVAVDGFPYAETILEPSPLNRPIKQGAPGEFWQPNLVRDYSSNDRTIKKSYTTNIENEVLLWIYSVPTASDSLGTVNASQYYAANTLYRNFTKDEQQNQVIEYIDLEGKVILKRVQATGSQVINDVNYASTYYIYDDFNNLVCVIPPEAVKQITENSAYFGKSALEQSQFLQKWAFRYRYDGRKRMVIKQVPGAKNVYMLYDQRDRLVMTQDGRQRALTVKEWTFTKHDALNRPVLTGIYSSGSSPSSLQNDINNFYATIDIGEAWFETYIGPASGQVMGYDNRSFPQVSDASKYLTATYYDIYDSFIAPAASQGNEGYDILSQNLPGETTDHQNKVTGRVTATQIRNLTTGAWMRSVNYYDDEYRIIQTITDHHKGTVRTSNVYDFIGRLMHTQRKYVVDGTSTIVRESFTYDHMGRQLTANHSIGEATPVTVNTHEYNELGQLVAKKLHKTG